MDKYVDRQQAGKVLAEKLMAYANKSDVLILALPRGGVPVAYEIAKALHAPLDVFIVRKLGVPGHQELAMGAIATGGSYVLNDSIVRDLQIPDKTIEQVKRDEEIELERREQTYRPNQPPLAIEEKTIILVDDGIATGATMRAAIKALRQLKPRKLIIAIPVADTSICEQIAELADKIICPLCPVSLYAVGSWYETFSQTSDEEVRTLLKEAKYFLPHLKGSNHDVFNN